MKIILIFTFTILCLSITLLNAQVADGITYQAVALDEDGREIAGHDINGNIIHNKQIGVRFSIINGTETGEILYSEEHSTYTDHYGLFSLVIGHGDVIPDGTYQKLTDINWGDDKLFLKVEIDIKHSGNYKLMGIQQMMAVPFAFYAFNSSNYELQTISINGDTIFLSNGGYVIIPVSFSGDYNDLQNRPVLSSVATTGSYSDLLNRPSLFSGDYNDLLNKPDLFSGDYYDLTNRPSIPTNVSELTNDAGYITSEIDGDPTNEIQELSLSNDTLYLSKSNYEVFDVLRHITPTSFYPQGIAADYQFADSENFTVPSGMVGYLIAFHTINDLSMNRIANIYDGIPILPPGIYWGIRAYYFLVNQVESVQPILTDLRTASFAVPGDKIFVLTSIFNSDLMGNTSYGRDAGNLFQNLPHDLPCIFFPGEVLSTTSGSPVIITGYLIPLDTFGN